MPMHKGLGAALLTWGLLAVPAGQALAALDEDEPGKWEEAEVQLPAPPNPQNLASFYVSEVSENRFFVDSESLSVGKDGVVRYTLVVVTPAGARNVSFEGMRCETRERRPYAFGRPDGTWSKARSGRWEKVREGTGNRHHAALFQEYFCPGGVMARNKAEVLEALRRGGPSRVPVAQW